MDFWGKRVHKLYLSEPRYVVYDIVGLEIKNENNMYFALASYRRVAEFHMRLTF